MDVIRYVLTCTRLDVMCLCESFIDCNVANLVELRNRNRHRGGFLLYIVGYKTYQNCKFYGHIS